MTCFLRVFAIGAVLATGPALMMPAAAESWTISRDQLACLVENRESYLTASGDPMVVFVQACPETDPAKAMSASAENSGSFNVTGGDSVLVLTRGEFACLVELGTDEALSDPVVIPREGLCD